MKTITNDIIAIVELLKNGAFVSGNDPIVDAFRQRCLEQAFFRITTDVIPQLISSNTMRNSDRLKMLSDITSIEQKFIIRPELSPCPRLGT